MANKNTDLDEEIFVWTLIVYKLLIDTMKDSVVEAEH